MILNLKAGVCIKTYLNISRRTNFEDLYFLPLILISQFQYLLGGALPNVSLLPLFSPISPSRFLWSNYDHFSSFQKYPFSPDQLQRNWKNMPKVYQTKKSLFDSVNIVLCLSCVNQMVGRKITEYFELIKPLIDFKYEASVYVPPWDNLYNLLVTQLKWSPEYITGEH